MTANHTQQILDRILGDLRSSEAARCLNAINELKTLQFSSPAILNRLENIAVHHLDEQVRDQARQVLGMPVHQFIHSKINKLERSARIIVLSQIEQWERADLLKSDVAEVLRRRYDFDIVPPPAAPKPVPVTTIETPPPLAPQAIVAGPRPTLTQTLLSEASIKIYLYLGAFFVIASALILAAVVEAARLPILTAATLAFGGAALFLRKRLPQPSFALFIVFSFLLPIDANVLEETLSLREPVLSIYWTILFIVMAILWSWSVWLYESRFFSAVAYIALSLAFYRFGRIFESGWELEIFLGMLASLVGLAGSFVLSRWKDDRFSLTFFLLSHAQVGGLLFVSVVLAIGSELGFSEPVVVWPLYTLTWLAAALFYVLCDRLRPGFVYPWLAAAALLPLPWFTLNSFTPSQTVFATGFWVWGALFALGSEWVFRVPAERVRAYHWPLLSGSAALLLASFILIAVEDVRAACALFALTALVYTGLHVLRPRWYVWSVGIASALAAYITFFQLPGIEEIEFPYVYQLLIASLVLLVPELFTRTVLSLKEQTRCPVLAWGVIVALPAIGLALMDLNNVGRSSIVLIAFAVLVTLHGLHSKREWLGYIAAALEALALIYALEHFNLDWWLPVLTLLAGIYYAAGSILRRSTDELKSWGPVLVDSGLVLGVLLSLTSLIQLKEFSGWYVAVMAILFAVEVFARPMAWLELLTETMLSVALFLILQDFNVSEIEHFLFGASLIWLGGDLIFAHFVREKRRHKAATMSAGFALAFFASVILWTRQEPTTAAVYFFLYTLFFIVYALAQRQPDLGFFASGFLALTVIETCSLLNIEKSIFPLIALATVYYLIGYGMRASHREGRWARTFLWSGLILGVITSVAAPIQGGLEAAIPVAIAATLFAAEAYAQRDVWWAVPADALYLMSYFMILAALDVDEPQFYSIGAALLGMLMHALLTWAGSKTGAFLAGMLSQLVLLGTTYIQMVSTERLSFFFVLFVQSMVVLVYGLVQRSRSLVITPIVFAVIGVMTVAYSALKGLGPVILIGSTGLVLLMVGIVAVLMRERITKLGEQLSDWRP